MSLLLFRYNLQHYYRRNLWLPVVINYPVQQQLSQYYNMPCNMLLTTNLMECVVCSSANCDRSPNTSAPLGVAFFLVFDFAFGLLRQIFENKSDEL